MYELVVASRNAIKIQICTPIVSSTVKPDKSAIFTLGFASSNLLSRMAPCCMDSERNSVRQDSPFLCKARRHYHYRGSKRKSIQTGRSRWSRRETSLNKTGRWLFRIDKTNRYNTNELGMACLSSFAVSRLRMEIAMLLKLSRNIVFYFHETTCICEAGVYTRAEIHPTFQGWLGLVRRTGASDRA